MEREYEYLLHLMGAFLRQEPPRTEEDVDWDRLTELARIHSVLGILGYMAMKYPICRDPRQKTLLRAVCLETIRLFAQRHSLAEALFRGLEEQGIDHILMKGSVLRDMYPVPELRTFNDIDLVIRREDRQRCDRWMTEQGFGRHTDWEPVFSYVRDQELYELHTDIMEIDVSDRGDYKGYFSHMWDYAREERPHSYRFTPEFHFLYLLTHIAKHIHGAGAGARMYLDLAVFIRHYGEDLDWDWIREQLKELALEAFANTALTAVEQWFGVTSPISHEPLSPEVLAEFTRFTMEAGVFGHHNREEALAGLKHQQEITSGSRMRQLLRRTFPSAGTIQSRYTYLQDKPWLLPAAWVHRLVKNREKIGKGMEEAQQILHADSAEVLRLQKLTKDIGL